VTVFDIENHLLATLLTAHSAAPWRLEAECTCSNPDGTGAGLVEFHGNTVGEVALAWHEHVLAEEAKGA